jgi:hypothetical protein
MALRTGLPIYATGEALAHAQPLALGPGMAEGNIGAWLQRVKPDDFSISGDDSHQ